MHDLMLALMIGVTAVRPSDVLPPQAATDTVRVPLAWAAANDSVLAVLQRRALETAPEFREAQAMVRAAEGERRLASADRRPTLGAQFSYLRQQLAAPAFPVAQSGALPNQGLWDGGLQSRWDADLFGRQSHRAAAASARLRGAEATAAEAERQLLGDVARAYFAVRGAAARIRVAEANAAAQQRILGLTRSRLEAGRGTDLDVAQAETQMATTLARIPPLEAERASAEARLVTLTGLEPAALAALLAQPSLPSSLPSVQIDPAAALERRPDVALAAARTTAAASTLAAVRADQLPRLELAASVGVTTRALESAGGTGTLRYAVGPMVSWSFLGLGRSAAARMVERARAEAAHSGEESVRRRAAEAIVRAESEYQAASASLERLADAAAAAERATRAAQLRFEEGVSDFLPILDAQRTLLTAQDAVAAAQNRALTAWATLLQEAAASSS